jgi:hypothetical protein
MLNNQHEEGRKKSNPPTASSGFFGKQEGMARQLIGYLTLKTGVTCSSKTEDNFMQTTRCYVPGDSTLLNYHCENLKSYIFIVFLNLYLRL